MTRTASRAGTIYNAVAQAAELASALGTQGEVMPGQMDILFMAAARAACPTVQEQEVKAVARVVLQEFEIARRKRATPQTKLRTASEGKWRA